MKNTKEFTIVQLLLAIQNVLQNPNIFNRSRETPLYMPFGVQKVRQFQVACPLE